MGLTQTALQPPATNEKSSVQSAKVASFNNLYSGLMRGNSLVFVIVFDFFFFTDEMADYFSLLIDRHISCCYLLPGKNMPVRHEN